MPFRVTILGCGGAGGVPSLSMGWGACDHAEPRNRRLRPSILIEVGGRRVLVDASPDLRQQLLAHDVRHLDAVVITHAHADHVHGIDDLREVNRAMERELPVWATPQVHRELNQRFSYCFTPLPPDATSFFKPVLVPQNVAPGSPFEAGGIRFQPFLQDHGWDTSLGLRIGSFAYSTDVVRLDENAFAVLAGVETWVVGCFSLKPHPTHATLETVLTWIERVAPRRAILTHMGPSIDYRTLMNQLPPHVIPAHDGLILE